MKAYKIYFHDEIRKNLPADAPTILVEIEKAFAIYSKDVVFAERSSNPIDKRLGFAAYFLATIHVLDQRGISFNAIRDMMTAIATAFVKPTNRFQEFMKRLPAKLVGNPLALPLLKQFDKRTRTKGHPDGFAARILTDKKETLGFGYGIDILECGICKLFAKHNHHKYAPILCEVDHITSGLAGLTLIRTGTIANGAPKCDFRFEKK